jgi:prepilin-type N-terminal cleavage/methylation domain-containing protein
MTGSASSPCGSLRKPSPGPSCVVACCRSRASVSRVAIIGRRSGFTLVELLVSIVIVSILLGLSAAGLAGVRTRGKAAKTRSTIRKLHEAIEPAYSSSIERRLDDSMWETFSQSMQPAASPPQNVEGPRKAAWQRLVLLRALLVHEMPDQWVDVREPGYLTSPIIKGYVRRVDGLNLDLLGQKNASAETLHLIVSAGVDSDALEAFREDEIGDTDGDGAREFLDGFGTPIHFIRWAPGAVTAADQRAGQDPFDPYRLGGTGTFPLTPLIVSAGPDEQFSTWRDRASGIEIQHQGSAKAMPFDPYTPVDAGVAVNSGHVDNITNLGMPQQ